MRAFAIVEYDGSKYCGFQYQPNGITVQQILEETLPMVLNQPIKVTASGRTDAGVHALGQVVHWDMEGDFPLEKLPLAIGSFLPSDIAIIKAGIAPDGFHARYSAISKTYIYKILLSPINRPMHYNKFYIYPFDVDLELMREAGRKIIGKHDFKGFMSSGSSVGNTVREVTQLDINIADSELTIEVSANGFLYNMVRIIVGTLLDIGRGRLSIADVESMVRDKERARGGATAPPEGLYLKKVYYKDI